MNGSDAIHPSKVDRKQTITGFSMGSITSLHNNGMKVWISCQNANVYLHFLTDKIFRVKLHARGQDWNEKTTLAIHHTEWTEHELVIEEKEDRYIISTTSLSVTLTKEVFRLAVHDRSGQLISEDDWNQGMGWGNSKQVYSYKAMKPDEKFYGFGEKAGFLNKRGTKQVMWNSDIYAPHNEETNALYESIPFFISLSSSGAYGIFLDNPSRVEFDLSQESAYSFTAEAGALDYYFFYGPTMKEIVRDYTKLTGRMALPPKWALGYHQSRYSYQTEDEVREIANTMREKQIPCDVIHFDIHYMDGYRVFTWHPTSFPNADELLGELREQGFHVVPIVDPGVKRDPLYSVYQEGIEHDYFCRYLEGELYTGDVWPGESAFPDFSNERVRKWWGSLHKHYTQSGIKGIWNDMNEPAVFNETKTMDVNVVHGNDGDMKTHKEIHNLYGLLMSKATYEGLKENLDGERPFVVTRAGYSGVQRYAAIWTGDNRSFWEHLAMCIPMFLNMGVSGLPFVGSDIGGFAHPANGPLLARWTQLGTFTPFCRNHSALDVPHQEPWVFGEEIEQICKKYLELRYKLMPHLYTLFREAAETGLPILRPLVMEYPDDPNTYQLSDQALVGDSILIAPVYRPDTEHRVVYLPEGNWVNYWTDEVLAGGAYHMVHTPLDVMPIFIKAGSIIVEGPVEQFAGEKKGADLHVHVYPGAEFSYTFYEDDGNTFAYEQGEYNLLHITGSAGAVQLSCQFNYTCRNYLSGRKSLHYVVHQVGQPTSVQSSCPIEWVYDQEKRTVIITVEDHIDNGEFTLNF